MQRNESLLVSMICSHPCCCCLTQSSHLNATLMGRKDNSSLPTGTIPLADCTAVQYSQVLDYILSWSRPKLHLSLCTGPSLSCKEVKIRSLQDIGSRLSIYWCDHSCLCIALQYWMKVIDLVPPWWDSSHVLQVPTTSGDSGCPPCADTSPPSCVCFLFFFMPFLFYLSFCLQPFALCWPKASGLSLKLASVFFVFAFHSLQTFTWNPTSASAGAAIPSFFWPAVVRVRFQTLYFCFKLTPRRAEPSALWPRSVPLLTRAGLHHKLDATSCERYAGRLHRRVLDSPTRQLLSRLYQHAGFHLLLPSPRRQGDLSGAPSFPELTRLCMLLRACAYWRWTAVYMRFSFGKLKCVFLPHFYQSTCRGQWWPCSINKVPFFFTQPRGFIALPKWNACTWLVSVDVCAFIFI